MGSSGRVFLASPAPGAGDTPTVAPLSSCPPPPPFPSLCPFFFRGVLFHLMKARTLDIQLWLGPWLPVLAVELPVLLRDEVPCWGRGIGGLARLVTQETSQSAPVLVTLTRGRGEVGCASGYSLSRF